MSNDQDKPVLEVNGLSKIYPGAEEYAIKDLSFTINPGEVFGFLGPNGAGKTTTISIISTLMRPTGGTLRIKGFDVQRHCGEVRKRISLVPQEIALYHDLTGRENLKYFGTMYGLGKKILNRKISETLAIFDIAPYADRLIGKCSGGIKRRFNIACGILHDPSLILLDEPTVGMDTNSRNALLDQIRSLGQKGHTILYTTHYMEEAQKICNRILIMDKGECLIEGAPETLLKDRSSFRNLEDLFSSLTGINQS